MHVRVLPAVSEVAFRILEADQAALPEEALAGWRRALLRMDRGLRSLVPGQPEHRVDPLPYALIESERVLSAGSIRDLLWSKYALKEWAEACLVQ